MNPRTEKDGSMAGSSKARSALRRLTEEAGVDGVLIAPKAAPGQADLDLVPGAALRWPPCRCGHSLCPDLVPPEGDD
ncbi:hypothetical protein [Streptomyces cyaneofuscatus]|uniref:hypothetical protein n=1 Tax=Streptomyces TaxID=1883 RepID=UPI002E0E8A43|nr:hypothetical protein OG366_12375 [Streptomyces cyaneofuscatus]WTF37699.1 hypothetical protein OG973_24225 [Streptomyces cyaneofuscatus]